MPTRGMTWWPQVPPAQGWPTRIHTVSVNETDLDYLRRRMEHRNILQSLL